MSSSEKSRQTFEQIAMSHLDAVYRAAFAICGNHNEAEDLSQGTFVRALEKFHTYKPGTNCKAWLFQILRHLWIDQLRHQKVAGTSIPIDDVEVADSHEANETTWSDAKDLLDNFSDEQVIKALTQLPDHQRLTLFLVDVEQLSQEDVAEVMDVAVGTVKSRASRARTVLKEVLEVYAQEMGFIKSE